MKKKRYISGIRYIITFMPGIDDCDGWLLMLSLMYTTFTTVISKQKRLTWLPYHGIVNGRVKIVSGAERSLAQRNDCPRSSIALGKNANMAISTGICSSRGKHPENGDAPARLYRAMVSCWRFMAFSWPGYFSLISLISGARRRILAWLL